MSEKEKTLAYLEKQISLMALAIEKTEELLEHSKNEMKKYCDMYQKTRETSEKATEEMTNIEVNNYAKKKGKKIVRRA